MVEALDRLRGACGDKPSAPEAVSFLAAPSQVFLPDASDQFPLPGQAAEVSRPSSGHVVEVHRGGAEKSRPQGSRSAFRNLYRGMIRRRVLGSGRGASGWGWRRRGRNRWVFCVGHPGRLYPFQASAIVSAQSLVPHGQLFGGQIGGFPVEMLFEDFRPAALPV